MDTQNLQIVSIEEPESSSSINFDFHRFLRRCLRNWHWIFVCVALCVGMVVAYILTTRPVYVRNASVLIKEAAARRATTSDIESALSLSTGGSMSSKVVNEVYVFESPDLMQEAVKRLNLTTEYFSVGTFRDNVIYGTQVPIEVKFAKVPTHISAEFKLEKTNGGKVRLTDFKYYDHGEKMSLPDQTIALGSTIHTKIGDITIEARKFCTTKWKQPILVRHYTLDAATMRYTAAFKSEPIDVKNHADVLSLAMADHSKERADDIINTIITIYNEKWVEDKNRLSISTNRFIEERLALLEQELGKVDDNISAYKSANLQLEPTAANNLYMSQVQEAGRMGQELANQLSAYKYVKSFLQSNPGIEALIPLPAGMSSNALSQQVNEYNRDLLARNNLRTNSSADAPAVRDMEASLRSVRVAIEQAFDNQIATIEKQMSNLMSFENENNQRMAQTPEKAKHLLSMGRQQKVKEQLYLYLLEKREENELGQAFTAYNTRVITRPMGSARPASPKKTQLLAFALALGLFIPIFIIYVIELTDKKIRSKHDLKKLNLPSLGEIPFAKPEGRMRHLLGKKNVTPTIIVNQGVGNVINEAFRVLRTNIEFTERDKQCPVISITSFQPGSGKTFISMNTASALALKGKRVLVIDGDLRRSSSSEYIGRPRKGLSDYLAGFVDDVQEVIMPVEGHDNLFVLPVGSIAPNPSELISNERFGQLIEDMKASFDYIIIDCPPVDIVADTQIINAYVDSTIFVVRAGLLEKKDVPNLQQFYDQKRFKNLCYLFNGVEFQASYYGHYGHYGHYGKK